MSCCQRPEHPDCAILGLQLKPFLTTEYPQSSSWLSRQHVACDDVSVSGISTSRCVSVPELSGWYVLGGAASVL